MAIGGAALKFLGVFLYGLACCCSIVVLALYSYFLATLHSHGATIPTWERAVEGISGAGALYTICAVIFTCCLGGLPFFAFLAIVLDILFCGGFIAIAVMARSGTGSCFGNNINTPIGDGNSKSHVGFNGKTFTPSLRTACLMNKAVLAVAVIGAFIFLISAFVQLWLGRHHMKQKKYGPSPANNYTQGNGIRFFKRRGEARSAKAAAAKDAEAGLSPETVAAHDSVDPRYGSPTDGHYTGNKYEASPVAPVGAAAHYDTQHSGVLHNGVGYSAPAPVHNSGVPTAGGYHTGPAGSAVNPYGYDNTRTNY